MTRSTGIVSGPADIMATGTVISYKNNPIQIPVAGIFVVFRRHHKKSEKPGIFMQSQDEKLFLVEINRLDKPIASIYPEPFAEISGVDENEDKETLSHLSLSFLYKPLNKEPDGPFQITFTVYAVQQVNDDQ